MNTTLYTLNNPRQMGNENVVDILDKNKKVWLLHLPPNVTMNKEKYYLLTHSSIYEPHIRFTSESKIYNATPFKLGDVVKKFKRPDIISVGDALSSNKHRRCSVKGKVSSQGVSLTQDGLRREFNLVDEETNTSIKAKFWADKKDLVADLQKHDAVTLYAMRVDIYTPQSRAYYSINSTDETTVEKTAGKRKHTAVKEKVTIIAMNQQNDVLELFTEEFGQLNTTNDIVGKVELENGPVIMHADIENDEIIKKY